MNLKESFVKLAVKVQQDLAGIHWAKAVIKIIRFDGTVRFEGEYNDRSDDLTKNMEVNFGFWEARVVHNIYKITTCEPPVHKDWNRAIFTLYPDNKFEIEYIWDQQLQDEVDAYNNGKEESSQ